jgi:hypothetical protein
MEEALRSAQAEAAADRVALRDLMRGIDAKISNLRSVAQAEKPGIDFAALENKLAEIGKSVTAISDRMTAMGKITTSDRTQVEARIDSVESRLAEQAGEIAQAVAGSLADRLDKAEGRWTEMRTKLASGELAPAISSGDQANGSHFQQIQDENARHWNMAAERMIALEAIVRAHLQGAEDAGKTHDQDLKEVYEALVKLGSNQQTLGNNLNGWRLENSGDVSIISNRLEQLENTILDMLSRVSAEMHNVLDDHSPAGEPRLANGFKRWLYGTTQVFTPGREGKPEPVPVSAARKADDDLDVAEVVVRQKPIEDRPPDKT